MKVCKLIYQKKSRLLPFSINTLILGLLLILFISACSGISKPHVTRNPVGHNPSSQSFQDATRLLPIERLSITQANFLLANQDFSSDLAILNKSKSKLYILLNQGGKGFLKKIPAGQWTQNNKEKINFFAAADLNNDGGDDLILILGDSDNLKTQILFNNKKGYFYPKEG